MRKCSALHYIGLLALSLLGSEAGAATFTKSARDEAMKRVKVWLEPRVPISQANLKEPYPAVSGWGADDIVECTYKSKESGGLTPKFFCKPKGSSDSDELIKVKPSIAGGEARTETATTRLLSALGFGADTMYMVKAVKCRGCPQLPYPQLGWFGRVVRIGKVRTFETASIEIKFDATEIKTEASEGWAVYELDQVNTANGGATRAEIDALRLMMVFLGHWDNKDENQRLVCLDKIQKGSSFCARPFAFIQDTGQSFGPDKENLKNWTKKQIWADAQACKVNLFDHPTGGATFGEVQISEEGRKFFASLITQLSRQQILDLFESSRIASPDDAEKLNAWADTFQEKVAQIADHPDCPALVDGGFTHFPVKK